MLNAEQHRTSSLRWYTEMPDNVQQDNGCLCILILGLGSLTGHDNPPPPFVWDLSRIRNFREKFDKSLCNYRCLKQKSCMFWKVLNADVLSKNILKIKANTESDKWKQKENEKNFLCFSFPPFTFREFRRNPEQSQDFTCKYPLMLHQK